MTTKINDLNDDLQPEREFIHERLTSHPNGRLMSELLMDAQHLGLRAPLIGNLLLDEERLGVIQRDWQFRYRLTNRIEHE